MLPDQVVTVLAGLVEGLATEHGPGHCVRIDSLRRDDAGRLAAAVRERVPASDLDVHVLADQPDSAPGSAEILAERAVELRNRKERALVLLVPVGSGAAASSLDNSFARVEITELLKAAGELLVVSLAGSDIVKGVEKVARELGRARPVEAWARYAAAVAEDPTWQTAGSALWMVGLVPDLGGADLVERVGDNVRCVQAISRPSRAVATIADRLTVAKLQEGKTRDEIARYLSRGEVDLSEASSWAQPLADPVRSLSFDLWPLGGVTPSNIAGLRVDPFLKEDGTLRTGTRLKQEQRGDLPYAEVGEGVSGSVTVVWRTEPAKAAVARWLCELLPPADLREPDTEPVAKQVVKGDKGRATVRIELSEDDVGEGALLVARITALGDDGQPLRLVGGGEAVEESQQFAVRWNGEPPPDAGRRASTTSLAQARLDAALDGQDKLDEDSPTWSGAAFAVRIGGRRAARLALSPVLVDVQRRALALRGRVTAWEASGRLGEVLVPADVSGNEGELPQALAERRRKLFDRLADRAPREVVETLRWDDELRHEVAGYCQSYRRALDGATDEAVRIGLLTLDTVLVSVDTLGHESIAAAVVLPLHPMRLAWAAEHDATLTTWSQELRHLGRSAKRRQAVDGQLAGRVTAANLPFTLLALDGSTFVHAREATIGTGVYLYPDEAEPGAAVQAVFDVLGLDRRDVPPDLPPASVAERFAAYRAAHPGQDAMRLLAFNAGSGELLARALTETVQPADTDGEPQEAPARVDITAYSRRPSYTDPLPALTDFQRVVSGNQVAGTPSYLTPPLGLSVRDAERLTADPDAAHVGVVADLARPSVTIDVDLGAGVPDSTASFRNLLTTTRTRRVDGAAEWRTSPALRARSRVGAADVVEAHRAYQSALAQHRGSDEGTPTLAAALGAEDVAALRSVHERADWVLTLDRHLGIDLFTSGIDGAVPPYVLDYAPDFVEGLGPRLTVTTTHRGEVARLLADAMTGLDLAAEEDSVRSVLDHLQVVSGRLALRLVGRSSLATEAVGLAAVIAHLRRRGELDGTVVVPVDAHHEVFGGSRGDRGMRRCDLILVRTTARTVRMECVEVKSRKAATLPAALVDEIADQLDSTVRMLHDTFFRTDPPRLDAELQRARLGGILRHHADRALASGLLDARKRQDVERMVERVEDGSVVPEVGRRGFVVSLGGKAGFPAEHRGVPIQVLTAADLGDAGFSRRSGDAAVVPALDLPADEDASVAPPGSPASTAAVDVVPPPATVTSGGSDVSTPSSGTSSSTTPGTGSDLPRSVEVLLGQDAHAEPVRWRISTDGSPHLFVLGIPGQGKSVTTRRILDSFAEQGLPSLVVDFHGDMAAAPAGGAAVLDAAQGLPVSPFELDDPSRYKEAAWELSEVIGYVCGLGEIQRNVVYEGVRASYERHGFDGGRPTGLPTMVELADAVREAETTGRGRNVAARLRPLSEFGLFVDPSADDGFADLLRRGLVLDVHRLMEQVQLAAGAFVLRKVYREMFRWGQTGRLRLAVVLDEAHRLARDVTLPKIMKEGRKYGVAVVVASQGVDDFHKDVLGNAGTKVAFRCNYPQSRTVAGFLRGRDGQDMSRSLEELAVGQAYVSTPDAAAARKVFMAKD